MDLHMGNKWSFCLSASEIAPTSRGSRDESQALMQSEQPYPTRVVPGRGQVITTSLKAN
jgi:hypothetical protein